MVCLELVPTVGERKPLAPGWVQAMAEVGYRSQGPVAGPAADRGESWEQVNLAALGGGQRRARKVLHFKKAEWAHVSGPLPELQPQPGPPRNLQWALDPTEEVKARLERKGRFEKVDQVTAPGQPKLAGYLYTMWGNRVVGVGSVVGLTAAARETAEQAVTAQGLSPAAIPFVPNMDQEDQARTQAAGSGRTPPGSRAQTTQEELRRGRPGQVGIRATELRAVRYVEPGGLLGLESRESVLGSQVRRELKVRRNAIEEHAESRQSV